jgi:hypothetical protein
MVDRVIKIIRDMINRIDLSTTFLNDELIQQVVHLRNHTKHYAYNCKFTPAQAEYNSDGNLVHM